MKVADLIESLQALPQDADVWHLWDGEARTEINVVYLAKGGSVITADVGMTAYSDGTRPLDAPSPAENRYWKTPGGDDE